MARSSVDSFGSGWKLVACVLTLTLMKHPHSSSVPAYSKSSDVTAVCTLLCRTAPCSSSANTAPHVLAAISLVRPRSVRRLSLRGGGITFIDNEMKTIKKLERKLGGKEKVKKRLEGEGWDDLLGDVDKILGGVKVDNKKVQQEKAWKTALRNKEQEAEDCERKGMVSFDGGLCSPPLTERSLAVGFAVEEQWSRGGASDLAYDGGIDTDHIFTTPHGLQVDGQDGQRSAMPPEQTTNPTNHRMTAGQDQNRGIPTAISELINMAKFAAQRPIFGTSSFKEPTPVWANKKVIARSLFSHSSQEPSPRSTPPVLISALCWIVLPEAARGSQRLRGSPDFD